MLSDYLHHIGQSGGNDSYRLVGFPGQIFTLSMWSMGGIAFTETEVEINSRAYYFTDRERIAYERTPYGYFYIELPNEPGIYAITGHDINFFIEIQHEPPHGEPYEMIEIQNEPLEEEQSSTVPTPVATPAPPPGTVTREVTLFNRPYIEVGNASWFNAYGDAQNNVLRLFSVGTNFGPGIHSNYVVCFLGYESAILHATLTPPDVDPHTLNPRPYAVMVYRIFGDGILLRASPALSEISRPMHIEIDVSGVNELKIEMETTVLTSQTTCFLRFLDSRRGLENAIIVVAEYQ